eukprot:TRINITY_DN6505_c0_g1_i1.p1 TRINITY_DN6505_c0_g1~~TRINITY_DN6505_c0_g1_i1.p1  ORF type:complete len:168 (+),score=32.50 TRINITY_DN6505_c0_g1_i1:440-943(+)
MLQFQRGITWGDASYDVKVVDTCPLFQHQQDLVSYANQPIEPPEFAAECRLCEIQLNRVREEKKTCEKQLQYRKNREERSRAQLGECSGNLSKCNSELDKCKSDLEKTKCNSELDGMIEKLELNATTPEMKKSFLIRSFCIWPSIIFFVRLPLYFARDKILFYLCFI